MSISSEASSSLLALSQSLADAVERSGRAVVGINARRRMSASGVHWRQGILVTVDHAIKREEEISVNLSDRSLRATLLGRDSTTDLAVLKLPETDLPRAEIGDPSALKVGHIVMAIGRSGENGVSASLGVISSLGGQWRSWSGGQIDQFIRPDLSLYSGLTGGPLINPHGQVLGINTSGPRNLVLTIPASTINRVVNQILERGHITRGYLGLGMQPVRLPDRLRQALNLDSTGGVMVVTIEPDGPSEQAGVLIGDIIVGLEGTPVNDTGDVQAMLDSDRIGKPLQARIIRGGTLTDVTIILGERPRQED